MQRARPRDWASTQTRVDRYAGSRLTGAMPKLSQTAHAIRPGVFSELERAISERRAAGGDLVPLHIGDTCLPPPAASRFERHLHGGDSSIYAYGATVGLPELRDALAHHALLRGRGWGTMTGESNVQLGVGATHALSCAARVVLERDDEVLLASPYWPLAHGILASAGANVVEVPLTSRLYADPSLLAGDLLRERLTDRTRAIYVITPNNPDGKTLSVRDLSSVAALARERDLWVFADEVYADYAFASEHVSIARLDGMSERTISAYSFSKSHALAGARVGWVIAPSDVVSAMRKVSTHSVFNVPVLMQRAALAALGDDAWVADARSHYLKARDAAHQALRGTKVRASLADGGVYLFADFAEALEGRPLAELLKLAVAEGVLLAPGEAFGAAFTTHARICYTSAPLDRVMVGIERLKVALGKL